MAVADLAHPLEVAGHRRHRAQGGANHRLGDKRHDVLAAKLVDLRFELLREPLAISFRRLIGSALAILVNRRDVMRLDQQRREGFALPGAAADRERAGGDAVIALPARDQVFALRLADLDEILPRQLERGLDRLRAAAHIEHMADAVGRMGDEIVGQLFRRLRS